MITLADLSVGERARVVEVAPLGGTPGDDSLVRALLEMGVLEGSDVRVLHQAPVSGDPIAVEVRGALIALRRQEARCVRVEKSVDGGMA